MSPVARRLRAVLSSARTGGRDDWRTPLRVTEPMIASLGRPALDPCASCWPDYHLATINLDARHDGLTLPWCEMTRGGGYAFVNWPYSSSSKWADKIIAEAALGCPIVGLGAARPGAQWYRSIKAVADAVGEVRGRLSFLSGDPPVDPDAPPKRRRAQPKRAESAPFPSALFAINISHRRFARAFAEIADVELMR